MAPRRTTARMAPALRIRTVRGARTPTSTAEAPRITITAAPATPDAFGGTTTGEYGAGAVHTTPYGTSTYGSIYRPYNTTAYHPPAGYPAGYYGYNPQAAVPYYGSTCYNCGSSWGAVAVGAAVGATVTAAAVSSATRQHRCGLQQGHSAGATTAAATTTATATNSYNAGYAAGATNAATAYNTAAAANTYTLGQTVVVLPTGCITPSVPGGGTYYLCGNTWFTPSYGANGVYYSVVTAP